MTQENRELFLKRLAAIEGRIEDMRVHLAQRADVADAVKHKLAKFHEHSQQLKAGEGADHEGAKDLESGLESWISEVDKDYGSPPKRVKNVSM